MKVSITDFEFKPCTLADLDRVLELQDDAVAHLAAPHLLRKNTVEMLAECLQPPHVTLGAWYDGRLVAFSVLYVPQDAAERLDTSLEGVSVDGVAAANYKLCIVDSAFRGNGLQYELGVRLIEVARGSGIQMLCVTASPDNSHSIANIGRMGFTYNRTLGKYGFIRNLYYKML